MSRDDLLRAAADSVSRPHYLSSKAELVEYYKDTYGRAWKQTLVKDLSRETGVKPKSLERRFDPSRLDVQPRTAKAKDEYKKLGETLSPVSRSPTSESITITVTGTQKTGRSGSRERTISVTFTGPSAYQFVNDPSYWDIWEEYGVDGDIFDDGDYAIDVDSVSAV